MKLEEFKARKIGIFGFGAEGESLLRYLNMHSVKNICVFDEADLNNQKAEIIRQANAQLFQGPFKSTDARGIEVAFRSPGLKKEKLIEVLPEGTKITSPTNLFFAEHRGRIIGITGTKGKSTTVSLVAEILKQNSVPYFLGGNIGNPLLEFVDRTTNESVSVLELSSFQLEDLNYCPDIAVLLPVYLDHLDFHEKQGLSSNFHENEKDYLLAKSGLVNKMSRDSLIIAYDSKNVREIIRPSDAKKIYFSEKSLDSGCFCEGNDVVCTGGKGRRLFEGIKQISQTNKIPEIDIIAALSVAYVEDLKVDLGSLMKDFLRLPFRIQMVLDFEGIKYFNDSAATNPISTIQAMKTMNGKYALIMGGSSKNLRFDTLATEAVQDKNLSQVYLVGETADEIESELKEKGFTRPIFRMEKLDDVIDSIRNNSREISAVLFSPASASFDQYANYKDRGEAFNDLVGAQNG